MFGLGPTEMVIIAVILLMLFGAKKLPELARGIGQSAREFQKGVREIQDEPKPAEK